MPDKGKPMSEYIEEAKDAIVKVFSECKGIDVKRDTIHLEIAAQCGGGLQSGKRCRFTIGENCKYYVETYKSDGGECITVCIYKKFCAQGIVINKGGSNSQWTRKLGCWSGAAKWKGCMLL